MKNADFQKWSYKNHSKTRKVMTHDLLTIGYQTLSENKFLLGITKLYISKDFEVNNEVIFII